MKILVIALCLFAASVEAATLIETKVVCDSTLTADMPDGAPHIYAQCATFDSSGQMVRNSRLIEITNRLTAQQRAGVLLILQTLPGNAAAAVGVPTPTATSTP